MPIRTLLLTALAPAIWGSSYIVTTTLLPGHSPLVVALLRALPAGLLLLLLVRQLPPLNWLPRLLVLGALNFSLFWVLLFMSAYRLPGGVAATLGAVQPLIVVFLSALLLKTQIRAAAVAAALLSMAGVALLVLTPAAKLDTLGVLAGLGGAASMAAGVVLTRKWQPPVPPLTFTAWQLTAAWAAAGPRCAVGGAGAARLHRREHHRSRIYEPDRRCADLHPVVPRTGPDRPIAGFAAGCAQPAFRGDPRLAAAGGNADAQPDAGCAAGAVQPVAWPIPAAAARETPRSPGRVTPSPRHCRLTGPAAVALQHLPPDFGSVSKNRPSAGSRADHQLLPALLGKQNIIRTGRHAAAPGAEAFHLQHRRNIDPPGEILAFQHLA